MQKSFEICSAHANYEVKIGDGLLTELISHHSDAIFLIDQRLENALPSWITKRITVDAIETQKSLDAMPALILKLRALGANRSSCLVAIGGGVIQDIATFLASIYMRGISWLYMPTTLLGMADSCIGGKSSINVANYKNLVGNIYPPTQVIIDVNFLSTLDVEQGISGLCEAAKICYAHSYQAFLEYLALDITWPLPKHAAQQLLAFSLAAKKWFIEIDEFDQKERLLLNFGHTFGHALEAATDFGIAHGVAVGIGMLAAVEYAQRRCFLNAVGQVRAAQLAQHIHTLIKILIVRGINWPTIDLSVVIEKFGNDKKHSAEAYKMVLPNNEGALELMVESRGATTDLLLCKVYKAVLTQLGITICQEPMDIVALGEERTGC